MDGRSSRGAQRRRRLFPTTACRRLPPPAASSHRRPLPPPHLPAASPADTLACASWHTSSQPAIQPARSWPGTGRLPSLPAAHTAALVPPIPSPSGRRLPPSRQPARQSGAAALAAALAAPTAPTAAPTAALPPPPLPPYRRPVPSASQPASQPATQVLSPSCRRPPPLSSCAANTAYTAGQCHVANRRDHSALCDKSEHTAATAREPKKRLTEHSGMPGCLRSPCRCCRRRHRPRARPRAVPGPDDTHVAPTAPATVNRARCADERACRPCCRLLPRPASGKAVARVVRRCSAVLRCSGTREVSRGRWLAGWGLGRGAVALPARGPARPAAPRSPVLVCLLWPGCPRGGWAWHPARTPHPRANPR